MAIASPRSLDSNPPLTDLLHHIVFQKLQKSNFTIGDRIVEGTWRHIFEKVNWVLRIVLNIFICKGLLWAPSSFNTATLWSRYYD